VTDHPFIIDILKMDKSMCDWCPFIFTW